MLDDSLPDVVTGDDFRLQQILNNLINNALKFTLTGGITIEVLAESQPDGSHTDQVLFVVQDTGIGISAQEQLHIFDRFTQASSETSRFFGGSGLGLAIVRELVELYNGNINLESELGKGSRFSFTLTLPAATATQKAVSAAITKQVLPRLDGLKLLLAEDLPLNVLVAQRLLERQGATVSVADDGHKAIELATQNTYDIILMDLQMPNMDGIEAAHALQEAGVHTPIIALSADASPAARKQATQAGMASFVAKPFNPNHLVTEILGCVKTDA
jgi:CheY-like chemotaxis protein